MNLDNTDDSRLNFLTNAIVHTAPLQWHQLVRNVLDHVPSSDLERVVRALWKAIEPGEKRAFQSDAAQRMFLFKMAAKLSKGLSAERIAGSSLDAALCVSESS